MTTKEIKLTPDTFKKKETEYLKTKTIWELFNLLNRTKEANSLNTILNLIAPSEEYIKQLKDDFLEQQQIYENSANNTETKRNEIIDKIQNLTEYTAKTLPAQQANLEKQKKYADDVPDPTNTTASPDKIAKYQQFERNELFLQKSVYELYDILKPSYGTPQPGAPNFFDDLKKLYHDLRKFNLLETLQKRDKLIATQKDLIITKIQKNQVRDDYYTNSWIDFKMDKNKPVVDFINRFILYVKSNTINKYSKLQKYNELKQELTNKYINDKYNEINNRLKNKFTYSDYELIQMEYNKKISEIEPLINLNINAFLFKELLDQEATTTQDEFDKNIINFIVQEIKQIKNKTKEELKNQPLI